MFFFFFFVKEANFSLLILSAKSFFIWQNNVLEKAFLKLSLLYVITISKGDNPFTLTTLFQESKMRYHLQSQTQLIHSTSRNISEEDLSGLEAFVTSRLDQSYIFLPFSTKSNLHPQLGKFLV